MSGFEIFGVVAAVLPLITTGLPKFMQVLETFRNTNFIKEESLDNVSSLCTELKVTFAILQQLHSQCPRIPHGHHGIADEFKSLFRGFPKTVKRLRGECEKLTKKSTIGFILSLHRLEEAVQELERQIQRLFRRMTLLVTYLQRIVPDASWAIQYSGGSQAHGRNHRPSHIRELLKAQHSRPRKIGSQARFIDLGRSVGDFTIQADRYSKSNLVIVETCTFVGLKSVIWGELASQEVVRKLSINSPADWLGILICRAAEWVTQSPRKAELTIIYRYPAMADPNRAPLTLRSVLRHDDDPDQLPRPDMPLRVRLRLAREVSNAVLFVHVAGLVHKDIRPENILIFFPRHRPGRSGRTDGMGRAFLTGFGESRDEPDNRRDRKLSGGGMNTGPMTYKTSNWHQILYRHPSRVGSRPARFTMRHDIYALGITLFEIGLWRSFVGSPGSILARPKDARRAIMYYNTHRPLGVFNHEVPESERAIQSTLLVAARQLLPFAMGEMYTSIVVSCLTCLERDGGDLVPDEGACAKFIQNVLDRLDDIRI
ncbi:unnamed protein product [Rhizoctonia solani]|uniref:Protein kinase domain-containing protein n=1 Tax=Rhizoctonia solani TaxID=456999 RepID=A0A8H3DIT2_9AGAM|nr:unnamed protein product [Rhizoctonia solani]